MVDRLSCGMILVEFWHPAERSGAMPHGVPQHDHPSAPRFSGVRLVVAAIAIGLAISGCATSLGRLRTGDVQDAIDSARASIDDARQQDLSPTAATTLTLATAELAEARLALAARDGLKALHAAQSAQAHAQQAVVLARQEAQLQARLAGETARLNADLAHARAQEEATREAAQRIRADLADLRRDVAAIKADADRTQADKRQAESRVRRSEESLRSSEERVRELTQLLERTAARQEDAESELTKLSALFEAAQKALASARANATTEGRRADEVAKEAEGIAAAYSRQIDQLERKRQQDAALTRARRQAQQTVAQPLLSDDDIRSATPIVRAWKSAWETGNLEAHSRFYAPAATATRVNVRKGVESTTSLPATPLTTMIQSMDENDWITVPRSSVRAEGDAIVAEAAYRRRADAPVSAEAFDFWVRRAFWRRLDGTWRIDREEWRLYDDVPDFSSGR